MTIPSKIEFDKLKEHMKIFLDFPEVEKSMHGRIDETIQKIMLTSAQNGGRDPVDVLTDYLDAGKDTEDRLKFIIGLSGGSFERMKRVCSKMFPDTTWTKIKNDEQSRRRVVKFLINPHNEQSFIPEYLRDSFKLPTNWIDLFGDKAYLRAVAHNMYQSQYAVHIGEALEKSIRDVVSRSGNKMEKGAVEIVDNKEVDIAIPNCKKPRILIMSSYQLTTASAQTSRANEQARMYQDVQTHNRRKQNMRKQRSAQEESLFVNVVDGGGWLARPNDLYSMWRNCDYCYTHATINDLANILR